MSDDFDKATHVGPKSDARDAAHAAVEEIDSDCTHEHTHPLSPMWPGYDECLDCGAVTR